jgi:tetratricopeptide (TPR) repeat protein
MTINNFLKAAWQSHDKEGRRIFSEIEENLSFVIDEKELLALANLTLHICSDHLRNWKEGLDLLAKFKSHPMCTNQSEIQRQMAILDLCLDSNFSLESFSSSDQARIFASTALALKTNLTLIEEYLQKAISIAQNGLEPNDPAQRVLAISCNNIALALEEKNERSLEERELMIKCAQLARSFWEVAGNWMNVERAEYRLSRCYFQAGDIVKAQHHALQCLEIVKHNESDPIELFFAYEVLVLSFGKESSYASLLLNSFSKLKKEDQDWCSEYLKKSLN